ncbi:hypothetical protein L1987_89878 [Smallanthus sonchifolius]|nr:hypothetical protein L1987_89878 [Smallanthus sonchifolius]
MSGQFRINGKIWVRVLADLPITGKPTEVRMGRGKGNPTGWIARVPTGQIPFEMDDVSLSNARQAATLAAHKLCSSTKFSGRNARGALLTGSSKRSEILSGSERAARLIFKTLALMKRQADRKLCYLEHLSPSPSSVP